MGEITSGLHNDGLYDKNEIDHIRKTVESKTADQLKTEINKDAGELKGWITKELSDSRKKHMNYPFAQQDMKRISEQLYNNSSVSSKDITTVKGRIGFVREAIYYVQQKYSKNDKDADFGIDASKVDPAWFTRPLDEKDFLMILAFQKWSKCYNNDKQDSQHIDAGPGRPDGIVGGRTIRALAAECGISSEQMPSIKGGVHLRNTQVVNREYMVGKDQKSYNISEINQIFMKNMSKMKDQNGKVNTTSYDLTSENPMLNEKDIALRFNLLNMVIEVLSSAPKYSKIPTTGKYQQRMQQALKTNNPATVRKVFDDIFKNISTVDGYAATMCNFAQGVVSGKTKMQTAELKILEMADEMEAFDFVRDYIAEKKISLTGKTEDQLLQEATNAEFSGDSEVRKQAAQIGRICESMMPQQREIVKNQLIAQGVQSPSEELITEGVKDTVQVFKTTMMVNILRARYLSSYLRQTGRDSKTLRVMPQSINDPFLKIYDGVEGVNTAISSRNKVWLREAGIFLLEEAAVFAVGALTAGVGGAALQIALAGKRGLRVLKLVNTVTKGSKFRKLMNAAKLVRGEGRVALRTAEAVKNGVKTTEVATKAGNMQRILQKLPYIKKLLPTAPNLLHDVLFHESSLVMQNIFAKYVHGEDRDITAGMGDMGELCKSLVVMSSLRVMQALIALPQLGKFKNPLNKIMPKNGDKLGITAVKMATESVIDGTVMWTVEGIGEMIIDPSTATWSFEEWMQAVMMASMFRMATGFAGTIVTKKGPDGKPNITPKSTNPSENSKKGGGDGKGLRPKNKALGEDPLAKKDVNSYTKESAKESNIPASEESLKKERDRINQILTSNKSPTTKKILTEQQRKTYENAVKKIEERINNKNFGKGSDVIIENSESDSKSNISSDSKSNISSDSKSNIDDLRKTKGDLEREINSIKRKHFVANENTIPDRTRLVDSKIKSLSKSLAETQQKISDLFKRRADAKLQIQELQKKLGGDPELRGNSQGTGTFSVSELVNYRENLTKLNIAKQKLSIIEGSLRDEVGKSNTIKKQLISEKTKKSDLLSLQEKQKKLDLIKAQESKILQDRINAHEGKHKKMYDELNTLINEALPEARYERNSAGSSTHTSTLQGGQQQDLLAQLGIKFDKVKKVHQDINKLEKEINDLRKSDGLPPYEVDLSKLPKNKPITQGSNVPSGDIVGQKNNNTPKIDLVGLDGKSLSVANAEPVVNIEKKSIINPLEQPSGPRPIIGNAQSKVFIENAKKIEAGLKAGQEVARGELVTEKATSKTKGESAKGGEVVEIDYLGVKNTKVKVIETLADGSKVVEFTEQVGSKQSGERQTISQQTWEQLKSKEVSKGEKLTKVRSENGAKPIQETKTWVEAELSNTILDSEVTGLTVHHNGSVTVKENNRMLESYDGIGSMSEQFVNKGLYSKISNQIRLYNNAPTGKVKVKVTGKDGNTHAIEYKLHIAIPENNYDLLMKEFGLFFCKNNIGAKCSPGKKVSRIDMGGGQQGKNFTIYPKNIREMEMVVQKAQELAKLGHTGISKTQLGDNANLRNESTIKGTNDMVYYTAENIDGRRIDYSDRAHVMKTYEGQGPLDHMIVGAK